MKGSFISKFSGDTTGAARCPGPTNPGAAGGTLTTRLMLRFCDMSSPSESTPRSLKTLAERAVAPFECRITDHALSREGTEPFILRRNSCLRRSRRAENPLETFAVLQENQNPQHASH